MAELRYPIGIQTFSEIRENGYVYVDKTEYIHKLIRLGKYFFLSRPRRFGKSLFLSTFHAFFAGKRNLFDGLAISRHDYDWKSYPVLHLDFTGVDFSSPDSLNEFFEENFSIWERMYGCADCGQLLGMRFGNIIHTAYEKTGRQVVILIDEYDKPLLETVNDRHQQDTFRNALRGVYGNLKKMDPYIKIAVLTGVTKFGHLNIFSDLNNLNDISMDMEFSGICGISSEELHEYFGEGIETFAKANGVNVDEAYDQLRINYDGYHFSPDGGADIYNPYSLLNALAKQKIRGYWFGTGTPTFLVKLIKSKQLPLQRLEKIEVSQSAVENVSFDMKTSLIPMLYQSGYLTIKDYDPMFEMLTLDYPNREVRDGFLNYLMQIYVPASEGMTMWNIQQFYKDVESGDAESFMTRLQSFFADFNSDSFNHIKLEQHYQDVTYIIFKLLGLYTSVEYKTASGRIDMVIKTRDYIYVFEFKLDKTPEEALSQIDEKGYLLPFRADGRRLIKIGANFSSAEKGLEDWIIEED